MRNILLGLSSVLVLHGCATTSGPSRQDVQAAARRQALDGNYETAARTVLQCPKASSKDRMLCLLDASNYYAAGGMKQAAVDTVGECVRMPPSPQTDVFQRICVNTLAAFARGEFTTPQQLRKTILSIEKFEQDLRDEDEATRAAQRAAVAGSSGAAGAGSTGSASIHKKDPAAPVAGARCRPREVVCGVNQACEPLPRCER